MASFNQAIQWMKEGKKVRRKYFDDKKFNIYLSERGIWYKYERAEFRYPFNFEDFEATDWEIYCEEHHFYCDCERNRQQCQKNCKKTCTHCGIEKPKEESALDDKIKKLSNKLKVIESEHGTYCFKEGLKLINFSVVENPPNPHAVINKIEPKTSDCCNASIIENSDVCSKCKEHCGFNEELKTLEDLYKHKFACTNANYFSEKELKTEAIKEYILLNDHYGSCKEFPFKIFNDRERKVLQSYIKWKNNLTEKDLK